MAVVWKCDGCDAIINRERFVPCCVSEDEESPCASVVCGTCVLDGEVPICDGGSHLPMCQACFIKAVKCDQCSSVICASCHKTNQGLCGVCYRIEMENNYVDDTPDSDRDVGEH